MLHYSHSSQVHYFPFNFLRWKKIQLDFYQWFFFCHQWDRGSTQCADSSVTLVASEHTDISVFSLGGEWHSSNPGPATTKFTPGSPLTWYKISCSHMLKLNQCSMGIHTENKNKASGRSLYFTHTNFPVQKVTYLEDVTTKSVGSIPVLIYILRRRSVIHL